MSRKIPASFRFTISHFPVEDSGTLEVSRANSVTLPSFVGAVVCFVLAEL